jgi:hypothetical protein
MRCLPAVLLLIIALPAGAGTITQTRSFEQQGAAVVAIGFNRLDPSLGPLNGIEFDVNVTGSVEFDVEDTGPPVTVTFSGLVFITTDAGGTTGHFSMPLSFSPAIGTSVVESVSYSGSLIVAASPSLTAQYVGNGQFAAQIGTDGSATADPSSGIVITKPSHDQSGSGTETITYFFGSTPVPMPEPPALAMLGIGLITVAGLCHRSWSSSPKGDATSFLCHGMRRSGQSDVD